MCFLLVCDGLTTIYRRKSKRKKEQRRRTRRREIATFKTFCPVHGYSDNWLFPWKCFCTWPSDFLWQSLGSFKATGSLSHAHASPRWTPVTSKISVWMIDWIMTSLQRPYVPLPPSKVQWVLASETPAPPILIPSLLWLYQIRYGRHNRCSNPLTSRATWQFGDAGGRRSPSSARPGCLLQMCPAPGARGWCWDSVSCPRLSPSVAAPRWCLSGPRRRAGQRQRARWRRGWGNTSSRGSSFCTRASFHGTC